MFTCMESNKSYKPQYMNYYLDSDNIYTPVTKVVHRDSEYDESGFDKLFKMQNNHFWYIGRHKFLLYALSKYLAKDAKDLNAIDLGGGVGGWLSFLHKNKAHVFSNLALGDSSLKALNMAKNVLPSTCQMYHIDLMNLQMKSSWDAAFLLDVIEHLPDDVEAIKQASESLKPGGLLFITTPAFKQFWSYNDEMANHLRRYTKKDYISISKKTGLTLLDTRYFMFFLSPIYLLSRFKPGFSKLTLEEKNKLIEKQHETPQIYLNKMLSIIFSLESSLSEYMKFPWGTSILAVYQKQK
jgi:SAM-dependent methyltransferase